MIELELKAIVPDAGALLDRLRAAGAREEFTGRMIDRRLDFPDGRLTTHDEVLRVRVYRGVNGDSSSSIDWKGPASAVEGYKRREEITTATADAEVTITVFQNLGLRVTRSIERDIRQFSLSGATVRFEHYQQMDDLVEVEGDPSAIEAAIACLGIARAEFSPDSLALFADRYTARTGRPAITGEEGESVEGST